jgi:hypothetical protein
LERGRRVGNADTGAWLHVNCSALRARRQCAERPRRARHSRNTLSGVRCRRFAYVASKHQDASSGSHATTINASPPNLSRATRRDGRAAPNPSNRTSARRSLTLRRRSLGSTVPSSNLMCRGFQRPFSEHVSTGESRFVSALRCAVAQRPSSPRPERSRHSGRYASVLDDRRSIEGTASRSRESYLADAG